MKKRIFSVLLILVLVLGLTVTPVVAKGGKNAECITIQDGVLEYSAGHYLEGQPLQVGYDIFGYNYQGHMFSGSYANAYLGKPGQCLPPYEGNDAAYYQRLVAEEYVESVEEAENLMSQNGYWPYRDVQLMMKWSDLWLSNKDCNNNDVLDRGGPGGNDTSGESATEGSWLTNHQSGRNDDGTHWVYFVKIVYPPGGVVDGNSDGFDDNTGGSIIWGSFIRTQQVSNDPAFDEHGLLFIVQPAGFGVYK